MWKSHEFRYDLFQTEVALQRIRTCIWFRTACGSGPNQNRKDPIPCDRFVLFTLLWKVTYRAKTSDLGHFCLQSERSLSGVSHRHCLARSQMTKPSQALPLPGPCPLSPPPPHTHQPHTSLKREHQVFFRTVVRDAYQYTQGFRSQLRNVWKKYWKHIKHVKIEGWSPCGHNSNQLIQWERTAVDILSPLTLAI